MRSGISVVFILKDHVFAIFEDQWSNFKPCGLYNCIGIWDHGITIFKTEYWIKIAVILWIRDQSFSHGIAFRWIKHTDNSLCKYNNILPRFFFHFVKNLSWFAEEIHIRPLHIHSLQNPSYHSGYDHKLFWKLSLCGIHNWFFLSKVGLLVMGFDNSLDVHNVIKQQWNMSL